MKILIVPDIHLGAGMSIGKDSYNFGLNSRIQDQKNLLDFVYEKAKEYQVDRIVVLGDIWDTPKPEPSLVYVFLEWLMKCSKYIINIDIVQGNHDFIRSGSNKISMLDCLDLTNINNCKIYTNIESFVYLCNCLTFVPFYDRRQLGAKTTKEALEILKAKLKAAIPEGNFNKKICFGHLAIEGSFWAGSEVPSDSNELFITKNMMQELGFDYVFMGHVHNYQVMTNKKDKLYMAHVGSLDKHKFSGADNSDKYILLYSNDKIEKIKLPCRELVEFTINIPKEEKDETNFVINSIKNMKLSLDESIVRLKINTDSKEYKYVNREKLSEFLSDNGVFNVSSITETKLSEQVLKSEVIIDETMGHEKAIDKYFETIKASDSFKERAKQICKDIIRG